MKNVNKQIDVSRIMNPSFSDTNTNVAMQNINVEDSFQNKNCIWLINKKLYNALQLSKDYTFVGT